MKENEKTSKMGGLLKDIENLIPLRTYCKQYSWPRLGQWQYWIISRNPVAQHCVKRIGKNYLIDLEALRNYIKNSSLDNKQ